MVYFPFHKQDATRENSQHAYKKFVETATDGARRCTLRGQLDFVPSSDPVDIAEVEPAAAIVKRFVTGWNSLIFSVCFQDRLVSFSSSLNFSIISHLFMKLTKLLLFF